MGAEAPSTGQPRSTIGKRDARGVVRHGAEWLVLWADPGSVGSPREREDRAAAARQREHRGRALAATLRALAGQPVVTAAPALPMFPNAAEIAAARGEVDDVGLRLRHHDDRTEDPGTPADIRVSTLLAVLEAARWRALGVRHMPGIRANLGAIIEARLASLGLQHAALAAQVPLAEALPVLALECLSPGPPLAESGALDMWRGFADRHFGTALASLAPHVEDQRAYARAARDAVRAMVAAMQWGDRAPEAARDAHPGAHLLETETPAGSGENAAEAREAAGRGQPASVAHRAEPAGYRAFSTDFDRVTSAAALVGPDEAARLRETLDHSLGDARATLSRLANRLARQLLAQQPTSWSFDQEEGMLDTARLDRVVTDPTSALSFKRERAAPARDTVVALLIDNSGSMRGRPITLAAMAADLTARALERCGIAVEILGFTTQGWRGGQSARTWAQAGRPKHPGRLGDLLHIVYKSASTPYRQARPLIAAMLRPELLRENIDGEALLWAAGRLLARPERRRLLLVVSDGAPSDRATLDANDALYLERHLAAVVDRVQRERRIELSAIGLLHPVDRIYRDAVVVAAADQLGPALLGQLGRRLLHSR